MSEPTIAAVEAAAAPLLGEAEKALAPEAQKVLEDLHQFVAGEADKLRQELPGLVQEGLDHLHALGASILARYQAVMEHVDAHLTGTVTPAPAIVQSDGSGPEVSVPPTAAPATVDPTPPAAPSSPAQPSSSAPETESTSSPDTTVSATPSAPTDMASASSPAPASEAPASPTTPAV